MTDNDNKLTPDAFSPASPSSRAGADEQLAATRFEPLSEAATTQRRISVTQLALALAGGEQEKQQQRDRHARQR